MPIGLAELARAVAGAQQCLDPTPLCRSQDIKIDFVGGAPVARGSIAVAPELVRLAGCAPRGVAEEARPSRNPGRLRQVDAARLSECFLFRNPPPHAPFRMMQKA
jgi:hypothetical protein